MAKYRGTSNYIGAWHYVLLDILYAIPVIGWIILLAHCFNKGQESRMHYARSKFAHLLLGLVVILIAGAVLYFTVGKQYTDHQKELDATFEKYQKIYETVNENFNKDVETIINQE